jgi:hypothetical protein
MQWRFDQRSIDWIELSSSTESRRWVTKLKELSAGHRKIILYANPGKEGFYRNLGFMRMRTAMAIFKDQVQAIRGGLVEET